MMLHTGCTSCFVAIFERCNPDHTLRVCFSHCVVFGPQFITKTGTKSLEVKEKGLDKAAGDLLRKLCEK